MELFSDCVHTYILKPSLVKDRECSGLGVDLALYCDAPVQLFWSLSQASVDGEQALSCKFGRLLS